MSPYYFFALVHFGLLIIFGFNLVIQFFKKDRFGPLIIFFIQFNPPF